MKKNDCNIPFITKLFGWSLVGLVFLYFFKESFEYSSWKCFLEKQGSLIGAVIGAIVLTFTVSYTIKKQAESVRQQIDAQDRLSEKSKLDGRRALFLDCINETFHAISQVYSACFFDEGDSFHIKLSVLRDRFDVYRDKTRILAMQDQFLNDDLFNEYVRYLIIYSLIIRVKPEGVDDLLRQLSDPGTLGDRLMSLSISTLIEEARLSCEISELVRDVIKLVLDNSFTNFFDIKERVVGEVIAKA